MKLKLIQIIALFLLMMVTGVFWGTWFSLSRTMEVFSAEEFTHIGKTIIANLAVPMRIILPACLLFMILSLWFHPQKRSAGFYLQAIALILLIGALLITLIVEVPIDNQIKEWTSQTTPPDWEAIRNRWEFFHTMRTFISMASFLAYSIGFVKKQ